MKKTLKLVGLFVAILVVGFAGGLSVYYLIQSNKTYYIYDLRFVEPVSYAGTYIYMNAENDYPMMRNKTVFMTSEQENKFEIAVFAYTSTNTKDIDIVSSDEDVAEIIYEEGKCYVKYKKAGEATITASIANVISDSFNVYVYNKPAEEFNVYDNSYYGKYAGRFTNRVVAYADDKPYYFDFITNSIFATDDNNDVNSALLRIDPNSVNTDIFESVSIDAANNKLIVKCKSSINAKLIAEQKTTIDESIVVQSYYNSKEGIVKVSKNYVVDVHVIADTPEFLQIELSTNPDFDNSYIYMDTLDFSRKTEEEIIADIDNYLSYQKAENYLANKKEKSTYTGFFTDKVSEIYLRLRKVYTNGDIVYLNPLDEGIEDIENEFKITQGKEKLTISQNKEYYVLTLDESDFAGGLINISLKLTDFADFESTFVFEYKNFTAENVEDFYDYYEKTNTFVYKYWDPRSRYYNEICDENGNVVNFGGITVDFDSLNPVDKGVDEVPEDTEIPEVSE